MKFDESRCAHKWLDGKFGIEIGGSAHNPFALIPPAINIDCEPTNAHKDEEIKLCGEKLKIDVIAEGDDLPYANNSWDYVLSSHVIEHFPNPIKAMLEWIRVVKDGGILYIVVPRIEDSPDDKHRKPTPLAHLVHDFDTSQTVATHDHTEARGPRGHYHMWSVASFAHMIIHINEITPKNTGLVIREILDQDDKVGNGFVYVLQVFKNGANS